MGDNALVTNKMITFNCLDEFINELKVLIGFNTTWQRDFGKKGYKIGDTELIKKPQRWIEKNGIAYQGQPINDTYATLSIGTNKHIGFDYGAFDEVLSIDDMYNRYFKTSIRQIANGWDSDACEFVSLNSNNISGKLGTNPASLADAQSLFLAAYALLTNKGCPTDDLTAVLSPTLSAAIVQYLNTNYNPQEALAKQFSSGDLMSKLLGFNRVSIDQNLYNQTCGTFTGTPLVNGAAVNGDSQIVTDGWTAGDTLNPGNVFSIAGTKFVNPKNRRAPGGSMTFAVGGNTVLTADANGNMTIPLAGGLLVYDSSQQQANLDVLPADNSALTIFPGTTTPSGLSGINAIAFGRQAFAFAGIELPKMAGCNIAETVTDPTTNISLSLHQGSDIKTFERISRIDAAGGLAALYADNEAVRLLGA